MKTATVAQIGNDFHAVLKWIETGEIVQVMQDGLPVAVISPVEPPVTHPDYLARLKNTFGDKMLSPETSAAIRDFNRGER